MKANHRSKTLYCTLLLIILTLSGIKESFAQTDLCGGAVLLTSSNTCNNVAGTLPGGATYTAIPTIGCGTANRNDVWYKFVAQSTNPTITLSAVSFANARLQLFSGTCAALTSVACGNSSIAATGLTIGATYLIRIYATPNANGTFNICIVDAPANNTCGTAITITSATTCVTTAGTVYGATNSAPTIVAPDCAGTVIYDVWYKFVAQTVNPTITLPSTGSTFLNPAMQLLSGACASLTPLYCGTTSIAADFLAPGTTYYIRVYSSAGAPPTVPLNADFTICVTDPVVSAPYNDECVNAINLPISISCSNVPGTVAASTASATPVAPCTGPVAYDVWYKFTAVSASSTINLTSIGANFTGTQLQLFSGNCGALTSIACGTTSITNATTAGTTYYVRVYSTTGTAPNGNANFNICVSGANAPVRFGNSYVNISKRSSGGVVQTGDTLEIRMTINHTSGTMYNLRYVDNIPSKTSMLSGANDSIRVITNEGLTYKRYTPAAGDDAGTYNAAPGAGEYNIRLNLGFGATLPGTPVNTTKTEFASATGAMNAASDKPRGGGGLLFATSYRVVVTGNTGDTINLNAGQFLYETVSGSGTDVTLTATPFQIIISTPLSLCSNSIGLNNAAEFGGTFGSGSSYNRSTDLTTPIAGYTFISNVNSNNNIPDGRYAIVKNMSPRSGINRTARRQNTCNSPSALGVNDPFSCNNRMFGGFWFIDGDHTGTNNSTGNTPPAAATSAGYMLEVNADFVASEVYRQDITNLCPNTYYEFSSWIRNICPTCALDSSGTSTYLPGVLPNLTYSLNDIDYYSTGEVDTSGWLKKGFVFKTGPAQSSATFSIRNNSQGGGGNDWAMDDIAVATCLPTMSYSPTINPTICQGNSQTINDTISSYFSNYTTYKWQWSVDGGSNWTDVSGVTTLPDTTYYITSYVIPPAQTTLANNGDKYRVVVATTAANLVNANCNISDGVTISISVLSCGLPLKTDLLSFNGSLMNGYGVLSWSTSHEDEPVHFELERSDDGVAFSRITTVAGKNNGQETNYYSYVDPKVILDQKWYRLLMINDRGSKKYSHIIQLKTTPVEFELDNVVNPFSDQLLFNVTVRQTSKVTAELMDMQGKISKSTSYLVYAGANSLRILNTESLAGGIYTLRVQYNDKIINRKVYKK